MKLMDYMKENERKNIFILCSCSDQVSYVRHRIYDRMREEEIRLIISCYNRVTDHNWNTIKLVTPFEFTPSIVGITIDLFMVTTDALGKIDPKKVLIQIEPILKGEAVFYEP